MPYWKKRWIWEKAGLSQRQLSEASGVPLRTIQQYEQQQKDIRKAAWETVDRLAGALRCRPEECTARRPEDGSL